MKKKSLTDRIARPASAAAALLLVPALLQAQETDPRTIYNGVHNLFNLDLNHDGILVGYGEGQNAELNLFNTDFRTRGSTAANVIPNSLFADSAGTGTRNTVVINIGDYAILNIGGGQNTTSFFGVDGDVTVNVDRDVSVLETRQAVLAQLPGSSAVFNIIGTENQWAAQPTWNQRLWFVDVGRAGTGTVNVLNGGRIITAQRLAIGGSVFDLPEAGGTGHLTVDGEGSTITFGNTTVANPGLSVGRRGTGFATVSNGAVVDISHSAAVTTTANLWVGWGAGGKGTLDIESGGIVRTDGVIRIATGAGAEDSLITVTGPGSRLESEQWAFVGNSSSDGTGTLNVLNGGVVDLENSLRVGNFAGARGIVNVDDAHVILGSYTALGINDGGTGTINMTNGARLDGQTYLHVGSAGTGHLNISGGSRMAVGLAEGATWGAFIGRQATAIGHVNVSGTGSELHAQNSLFLGAGPDGLATGGVGHLLVQDGATVSVGVSVIARGSSTIEIAGGLISVGTGSFELHEDTALNGQGIVTGPITLGGGSVSGTGLGLAVTGALSGAGSVTNAEFGGLNALASTSSLTLSNVRFASGAPVSVTVDQLAPGTLISFDNDTDFSNASLSVVFDGFFPDELDTIRVFSSGDYQFASTNLPFDWTLTNGVLHHVNNVPGGSAFEDWAGSYGLSGAAAAPGADPDGDGFTNLEEFAFGTNPAQPTATLFHLTRQNGNLVLRWNRAANGVQYAIQSSNDLVTWTTVEGAQPTVVASPSQPAPAGYEQVEWSAPIDGNRTFYRVVATVDPALLP